MREQERDTGHTDQPGSGGDYLQEWLDKRDREWLAANHHWFSKARWFQAGIVVFGVLAFALAMKFLNPELVANHPVARLSSWIAALFMYALYGGFQYLALDRLNNCQPPQFLVTYAPHWHLFRRAQLAIVWRTLWPVLVPLLALFTLNQMIGMVGMIQGDMLAIFRTWSLPFETTVLLMAILLTEALRVLFYCLLPLALFTWTKPGPVLPGIGIGLLAIWLYTRLGTLAWKITKLLNDGSSEASSPYQRAKMPIFMADSIEILLTTIVLAVLAGLLFRRPSATTPSIEDAVMGATD
ncbi:MAG: hypothetical protein H7A35_08025 [Planctomycetales bacterium]|nr:hypothetical protein [bacterium]UNM10001.1 MAG: hypothetical protein H7A35_08025 [Planctomycetales bacterium]